MTHPVSHPEAPSFWSRHFSLDAVGAGLLTATLLIAVALSSAEYARISADAAPASIAAAFAGYAS